MASRIPSSWGKGGASLVHKIHKVHKIRKRYQKWNDNFTANVRKPLPISTDYVADEAVYHAQCHSRVFFSTRSTDSNRGRPECPKRQTINLTCNWLENEIDLFIFKDFRLKMEEVSTYELYCVKKIKQKLQEKYKKNVFLLNCVGERTLNT